MLLKNPRHERFAVAVAMGRRQTQAYEEAGFEGRGKLATNRSLRLLATPAIKARIAELRAGALKEYRLNRRELLDYLADVILTPAGQVEEGGPLCQSFRTSGRRQIMRMPSKVRAAEMLAKLCGWLAPEKEEHPGGLEVLVTIDGKPSELAARARAERLKDPLQTQTTELKNPRHEKFAQGIAWGKKQARAYDEAGFEPKPGNGRRMASRLVKDPAVEGRIEDLRREAEAECRLSRAQLLDFLIAVMLTPASEVHEDHRLCEAFHRSDQMNFTRMPDKLRAAELVVKIHGWDVPEALEESEGICRTIVIGGEQYERP
jgi:hypothetical protein